MKHDGRFALEHSLRNGFVKDIFRNQKEQVTLTLTLMSIVSSYYNLREDEGV